jgi:hypothetical protein
MRHAEADGILIGFAGKGRLSMRAVAKRQASGHAIQDAPEDGPEHTTRDDKMLAIPGKIKLLSPRLFVRGKIVQEALNL